MPAFYQFKREKMPDFTNIFHLVLPDFSNKKSLIMPGFSKYWVSLKDIWNHVEWNSCDRINLPDILLACY